MLDTSGKHQYTLLPTDCKSIFSCLHTLLPHPLLAYRRNDFISVVRSAARTALELMGNESAKQVLNVTKILEEEIKDLEGEHAIV